MIVKASLLIIFNLWITIISHAQTQEQSRPSPLKEIGKEMKEFADNNYLQIGTTDIPNVLRRIEDQFKENIIDVIIHSKTHMPIFAQKRKEGYSKNYKNFFGLDVKVMPIKDEEDFYILNLFYYNWTTNKFDKKLTRNISKYNVLNEVRIATYEILMGNQWIIDNKEKIEARNFERIQAVRQVIEQNKKLKKKKKAEDKKKHLMQKEAQEQLNERNLIRREERTKLERTNPSVNHDINVENNAQELNDESTTFSTSIIDTPEGQSQKNNLISNKKFNKSIKNINKNKNANETLEDSPVSKDTSYAKLGPSEVIIPKKSFFHGFTNYFQESTKVQGLIPTTTDLKYLGVGGTFILERLTDPYQSGMRFDVLVAMPVFKEEYSFPIYRSIKSEFYYSNVLKHFSFFGGIDFAPNYFIGLPGVGERLQVYENDFLWAKVGSRITGDIKDKKISVKMTYLKSLLMKSNQTAKLTATKIEVDSYYQLIRLHAVELNLSKTRALGTFELASYKIGLSYVYHFEN